MIVEPRLWNSLVTTIIELGVVYMWKLRMSDTSLRVRGMANAVVLSMSGYPIAIPTTTTSSSPISICFLNMAWNWLGLSCTGLCEQAWDWVLVGVRDGPG